MTDNVLIINGINCGNYSKYLAGFAGLEEHNFGKGFMDVHNGENVFAVAPPGVIDMPYRFGGITPAAESMLALFAAGDLAELHESEWEDIFYNNAVNFYSEIIK